MKEKFKKFLLVLKKIFTFLSYVILILLLAFFTAVDNDKKKEEKKETQRFATFDSKEKIIIDLKTGCLYRDGQGPVLKDGSTYDCSQKNIEMYKKKGEKK